MSEYNRYIAAIDIQEGDREGQIYMSILKLRATFAMLIIEPFTVCFTVGGCCTIIISLVHFY